MRMRTKENRINFESTGLIELNKRKYMLYKHRPAVTKSKIKATKIPARS